MPSEAVQVEESQVVFGSLTDPFPGLRPFESNEESIFRGRQRHTDELLRRLAKHRFLAVVGTSGSGKSSLVRAGLLPALDRGFLAGASSRWRIAVMRPGMAPIENLAEALRDPEALGGKAALGSAALGSAGATKLRSSSLGLVETVRDAALSPGESLLVVADQFEELFRYSHRMAETGGDSEAALFVNLLLLAARRPDSPVYVVLTMRSDFLGDCAQFPGLPEALSESQYLIPRLTREQRRQAIEEPLRLFGASMTPQLVEQLLNDSGEEIVESSFGSAYRGGAADPLPVLQHALMRTYLEWKSPTRQKGDRIDLADYVKAGGMSSALNQHANHVFSKDLDDAGRVWAERIFRCLTTTELGRPVRRPTPLSDLYKIVGANNEKDRAKVGEVLAILRKPENSFVRVNRDTSVDISHESLIWKWKRLSDWVAKEAAGAELYRDLVKDAGGKATWGEPKLSSTLAIRHQDAWNQHWARQYSEARFADVESFLERSRKAVRNQRLLRWFGAAAAIGLVAFAVIVYELQQRAAQREAQLVVRERAVAALTAARDSHATNEKSLELQLAGIDAAARDATQSTQADRDRIAKEKADVQAQLKKSQDERQTLSAQIDQTQNDALARVNSLNSQLTTTQKQLNKAVQDLKDETKKRSDAESKAKELEAMVNSLTKDQQTTKDQPTARAPSGNTTPPRPESAAPPAQKTVANEPPYRLLQGEGSGMALAWSSDGKGLASANGVYTIELWDMSSGVRPVRVLQGHKKGVTSVAWTPNGKAVASGSVDTTIGLWNPVSGKMVRMLKGHPEAVSSVAWSPDGSMLASGSAAATNYGKEGVRTDKVLLLWDSAGRLIRALEGHGNSVESVAFSPDGKTLASGSIDETIRLWNAADGKPIRTLQAQSQVQSVTWSPDGRTIASGEFLGNIQLWDVASGKKLRTFPAHDNFVSVVAWSPTGNVIASEGGDDAIRLWDPESGKLLRSMQGHEEFLHGIAWSPDGKTLAESRTRGVRLWDVSGLTK